MCALSFGRALVLSRPKKPPRGFFPSLLYANRPRCGGGLWQRARSAAAAWRHPPLRPVAPLAPSSVSRQGLRKRSSLAPLPVAPSRAFPLPSARSGAVVRRCGLLSLRRSPRSVPRPRSPHAVPPVASLFCRSRSSAGGSRGRPLRGLPLGWVRSAPPAVLFRRAVGGAVSSFPVGVRCAFPLSALRRRGHHPPPASKAGAVLYRNPSRVNRQSSAYRQLSSRGRGSRGFPPKLTAAVQGFCFPLLRAAFALLPQGHSPLFCLLVCTVLFRRA